MMCSWIFSLLYSNSNFAKFYGLFSLHRMFFSISSLTDCIFVSHQIASRCHGKGVACTCSVWYAAWKSLVWHCCHHYWASQSKSRFRTGESGNWHYGSPLNSTNWKIESTDLNIFAPHKKVWYVIYCITIRSIWRFFHFHIEYFLLQSMVLCIIFNCRDCIFVSRTVWYDRWKIFDHSSSEIWLVAVAFHFVVPAGFFYLYLLNCLYNVFASVSQRGTILPPTEADKRLIGFCLDWFISDQLSPFHRKTVPNPKRVQEIAFDIVFFFNLAVVKEVTIFFNNVIYLKYAFRSPVGPYIRSIWNRNISVFPNS